MLAVVALALIVGGIWAIKKYRVPLPSIGSASTLMPKVSLVGIAGIIIIALELWLVIVTIGNPLANPVVFVGALVVLGAIDIGLYRIYKAAGAKVTVYLAYAALVLGGILGFVAVTSGPESAAQLLTWGRNSVTEGVNWFTDSDTTPGTTEVTATRFFGQAHGETFVIRDDRWSVFEWTDGYCLRQFGGVGLLERSNNAANTYSFLSPGGEQRIEVKLVLAGDSWHGDVCK